MQRFHLAIPLAFLSLAACSADESGAGSGKGPQSADLNYYQHVKPIFDAKCNGCHAEGGIAPLSLESYEATQPIAGLIKQKVVDKEMPPWPPDPACADYLGDRSLTDEQIEIISRWVDQGAERGNPADEGPPLDTGPAIELSRVDLSLSMPLDYTPVTQPDEYRCFVVDWPETETTYVTGFRANPGNAKVVHHVVTFLAPPGNMADKAVALDAADPAPGYTCFGASGAGKTPWLGSWAPGDSGADLPEGTGIKVEPGSKIIIQMHYNTLTSAPEPDRTTVDFKLDKVVAKEVMFQPWANPDWLKNGTMTIPANEADVTHSWAFDPTLIASGGQPFTMYASTLHMHLLGTRARFAVKRAGGGEECLLDIPQWNFHWQGSYGFAQPKVIKPGDQLYLECHWDNTPPKQPIVDGKPMVPKDVSWGEGTTDEMCIAGFFFSL